MIVGLGTDVVEIARIESTIERLGDKFIARILTPSEQEEYKTHSQGVRFLAKRFCAKEACAKALGTGIGRGVSWQHMKITHDEWGKPLLSLTEGAHARLQTLAGERLHLSLSDEQHYVVATVIID